MSDSLPPLPPLPTGFNVATATDTAANIVRVNAAISRGSYLTLTKIGDTFFIPAPTIEAIDRVDADNPSMLDPNGPDVAITVWFQGITRPHGMNAIVVDASDPISVSLNRPAS